MDEHDELVKQTVAEWLRGQSQNILTGCDELQNTGTTVYDLPSLPGLVSYQSFCGVLNNIASDLEQ